MNIVKLQDIKLAHRNPLHSYTLTERKQKEIKETIPFTIATKRIKCQTLSFWGSKITAVGDCSHEIKRRLLLGRKVMTNLDSIFKSRDITLPTKVRLVKAMVFPMVMYGCESWHPVLFLTLGESFQVFTIEANVCCGFVIYSFYYVEVCSFYSCFLESFFLS